MSPSPAARFSAVGLFAAGGGVCSSRRRLSVRIRPMNGSMQHVQPMEQADDQQDAAEPDGARLELGRHSPSDPNRESGSNCTVNRMNAKKIR